MRWLWAAVLLAVLPLSTAAHGQVEGDVQRGEAIYESTCAMCHGADATGMMGMHPALTGAVERLTVEGVEVTIRNGRATNPPMPAFSDRLDDTDIADLIAYIGGLPDGPRNFANEGDGPFTGRDGMNEMMGGGGAPTALWIVVVALTAAVAGVIGHLMAQRRPR